MIMRHNPVAFNTDSVFQRFYTNPINDHGILQMDLSEIKKRLESKYIWLLNVASSFRDTINDNKLLGGVVSAMGISTWYSLSNTSDYKQMINNIAITLVYLSSIDYAKDKLNLLAPLFVVSKMHSLVPSDALKSLYLLMVSLGIQPIYLIVDAIDIYDYNMLLLGSLIIDNYSRQLHYMQTISATEADIYVNQKRLIGLINDIVALHRDRHIVDDNILMSARQAANNGIIILTEDNRNYVFPS